MYDEKNEGKKYAYKPYPLAFICCVCGPIDRSAIDGSVLSTRLLVVVPCNYQTLPPPPIDRTVNTRQPMLPHHRCVTTNAEIHAQPTSGFRAQCLLQLSHEYYSTAVAVNVTIHRLCFYKVPVIKIQTFKKIYIYEKTIYGLITTI